MSANRHRLRCRALIQEACPSNALEPHAPLQCMARYASNSSFGMCVNGLTTAKMQGQLVARVISAMKIQHAFRVWSQKRKEGSLLDKIKKQMKEDAVGDT